MNTYKRGDKVEYYSRDLGRWVLGIIEECDEKNGMTTYTVKLLADGEMYWGYADQFRRCR